MPTITPLDFENEIREFPGQLEALILPPINQSNGFENFFKREDKIHKNRNETFWHNNDFKETQVIKAKN